MLSLSSQVGQNQRVKGISENSIKYGEYKVSPSGRFRGAGLLIQNKRCHQPKHWYLNLKFLTANFIIENIKPFHFAKGRGQVAARYIAIAVSRV
jgi:hypothetical protein